MTTERAQPLHCKANIRSKTLFASFQPLDSKASRHHFKEERQNEGDGRDDARKHDEIFRLKFKAHVNVNLVAVAHLMSTSIT
jgi:hypothetical protein